VAKGGLGIIEPSVGRALKTQCDDPGLAPTGNGFALGTLIHLPPRLLPILGRVMGYMLDPEGSRQWAIRKTEG
jgi:hypothetical protein